LERRGRKKQNKTNRNIRNLVLLAAALLIVVFLTQHRELLTIRGLTGAIGTFFGQDAISDDVDFSYDGNDKNEIAFLKGGLCVSAPDGYRYFDADGYEKTTKSISLTTPAMLSSGNRVLVYDRGGVACFLADSSGVIGDVKPAAAIISASINESNWFSLITAEQGYKGVATVYDAAMKERLRIRTNDEYLLLSCISPGKNYFLVATVGQRDGNISNKIKVYTMKGELKQEIYLGKSVPVNIAFSDRTKFSVVCDDAVRFFDVKGKDRGISSFKDGRLLSFTISENFVTYLVRRNKVGLKYMLVTCDLSGKELNAKQTNEEIMKLTSGPQQVAILSSEGITIYDKNLKPIDVYVSKKETRNIIMVEDGTILELSENSGAKLKKN